MRVQGLQDVVQEDLRSVKGSLERRQEGLPEVVYDRIKRSLRPHQLLHSWRPVSIGDLIQSSLSDIEHERIEWIREQNGWFLRQVDCANSTDWVRTTRYSPLAKELLDERYWFEL
jgi:hypothetical protein